MSTRAGAPWLYRRRMALVLLLLAGLLVMVRVLALPAQGRIISNISITEQADDSAEIHVEFTFPIRYLRHFPTDYGDTVEIRMKEVVVSAVDAEFLRRRESFRLPDTGPVPLLDVSYEGDLPGGPYLTIRFIKPVAFTVRQGSDFRSLTVTVFNNGASSD